MTKYFLTLLLAVSARIVLAEDKAPDAAAPVASAEYTTTTAETSPDGAPLFGSSPAAAVSDPFAKLSKLDNLRLAERHLKAAGLTEEAKRIGQMAVKEQAHSRREQIIVQFRMYDVSLTKCADLSSEKYGGSKDMTVLQYLSKLQGSQRTVADGTIPVIVSDDRLRELFDALCKDNLAKLVSMPDVVTETARPAYVQVGSNRTDVLPFVISGDRIHLDFRIGVGQPDAERFVRTNKNAFSTFESREVESGLDLRSGQTAIIDGGTEVREEYISVSPAGHGGKPAANDAQKDVRKVTNRTGTFVLVKAHIETIETAKRASIETNK